MKAFDINYWTINIFNFVTIQLLQKNIDNCHLLEQNSNSKPDKKGK